MCCNTAQQDVDQTSGSSSDEEEQEEKVGVGTAAMEGHVCGGLLQRTCEVCVSLCL
jgi:hypothetical protein